MGKFYITLISMCLMIIGCQFSWAQCPAEHQVQSQASNQASFELNEGEIIFSISSQLSFQRENYRIRLWEESSQRYIYDDNAPPFLNVPVLEVSDQRITFSKLPEGHYTLELQGGECHYRRYASVQPSKGQAN